MRHLHQSEKQRMLLSVLIAVGFHVVVFLVLEYGDFIKIGKPAEYVGPMVVEISDITTIPETKEPTPTEQEIEEEPLVEEPEAEPVEPEYAEETVPSEQPKESEATTAEEPETEVPTVEESEEEQPVTETEESYTVPTPAQPEPEEQPEKYNGTDKGNEFQIKLGSLAISPQPNIGPSIAAELPSYLTSRLEGRTAVVFSFIIGPDGMITHIHLEKSSGIDRIDNAVRDTLLRWKFSRPVRQDRVEGEFTYIIKP